MSRRRFVASSARGVMASIALRPLLVGAEQILPNQLVVDDAEGVLGRTEAPVCVTADLDERWRRAAGEGRLYLREEPGDGVDGNRCISVQSLGAGPGTTLRLGWLMPPGPKGRRVFLVAETAEPGAGAMQAAWRQPSGQYEISEAGKAVLRYNYAKVEPGDFLAPVAEENRKYAVARSDYIHPLYGPGGETLTKDWSREHPHHRGIYWAWPEVDWRGQRGDLHALQKVFARPTGKCEASGGPVLAQIDAENVWQWEDREPIVHERASIRAYRATAAGRVLDVEFHFDAVDEPVLLARRGTEHYGGLNLRFNAVKEQQITKHTDGAGVGPRKAWGELAGIFGGVTTAAGVAVIQRASNPDYPGDWIEYPELNWLQPTFPARGRRFELRKGQPLVLRFRLWIHAGAQLSETAGAEHWLAAHSEFSPLG